MTSSDDKKETISPLKDVYASVLFLTRVPAPSWPNAANRPLANSMWAFPVAGAAAAVIAGAAYAIADALGLPLIVAGLLAVAALIFVTGALHEDGLADTADGIGGGHDEEARLEIMSDSRIGAYGATLPPWQLEIVAGVVEDGETAEEVARRETVEECGCEILALHFAGRGLSSSGILSEVATLYCGIVNSSGAGGVHGVAGEGEDIRARVHSFDTAMKMVEEDAFHHMHGIAVLHWLNAHRDKLRGETP